MRRSTVIALALLVSGCATRPQTETPTLPVPVRPAPQPTEQGQLIGKTAADLAGIFGSPALQIHEGSSLKLQFRAPTCVLDAYLYPSGVGLPMRVTHVDARSVSGNDVDQAACISALTPGS